MYHTREAKINFKDDNEIDLGWFPYEHCISKTDNIAIIAKEMQQGYSYWALSYNSYIKRFKNIKIPYHHEVIQGNLKPVFDIECHKSDNEKLFNSNEDFLVEMLNVVHQAMTRLLKDIHIEIDRFIVLNCCTNEKYSTHIIYDNNLLFENIAHLQQFTMNVLNYAIEQNMKVEIMKHGQKTVIIDTKDFHQMRVCGASKRANNKPLLPFNVETRKSYEGSRLTEFLERTLLCYHKTGDYKIVSCEGTFENKHLQKYSIKPIQYLAGEYNGEKVIYSDKISKNENQTLMQTLQDTVCLTLHALLSKEVTPKINRVIKSNCGSFLLIDYIKCECPISYEYRKKGHSKETGQSLVLSLNSGKLKIKCEHTSCKNLLNGGLYMTYQLPEGLFNKISVNL